MKEEKFKNRNIDIQGSRIVFFSSNFLYSPYFYYIVPAFYFIIMILVSVFNRPIGDYGVESDFYSGYAPQAKEILNGNIIIDPFKGPLYQIILAITGFALGYDFFLAGKIINVISSSIALYFISRLIGSLLNRDAAFLGVLIIAVNYTFLTYTYTPDTDMIFLAFYISAVYFVLKSSHLTYRNMFIAGVLTSFAYLTRYTAISLILFVILVFIVSFYKGYKANTEKISFHIPLRPILFFFIPLIIAVSVWGLISYDKTGFFFYNLNYENTAYTVHKPEAMSKDEWNSVYKNEFKSMTDVFFKDAGKFSKSIFLNNLPGYFKKDMTRLLPKYFGLLVVLGLFFFLIKIKSTTVSQRLFLVSSLLFYLQILLIFYTERFSIPLLPFYCFMILWFLSINYLDRFNLRLLNYRLWGILIIILIAINLYTSFKAVKAEINKGPVEILTIKKWVEDNSADELTGKLIMGRKPHISYYLNMKFLITPFVKNYDEYFKALKDNNIDYVYISDKEADYLTDENLKKILLNYTNPPAGLEVVTNTTDPVAIIYKVIK